MKTSEGTSTWRAWLCIKCVRNNTIGLVRIDENRITNTVQHGRVEGTPRRGSQRSTLLKSTLVRYEVGSQELLEIAQDRNRWRLMSTNARADVHVPIYCAELKYGGRRRRIRKKCVCIIYILKGVPCAKTRHLSHQHRYRSRRLTSGILKITTIMKLTLSISLMHYVVTICLLNRYFDLLIILFSFIGSLYGLVLMAQLFLG